MSSPHANKERTFHVHMLVESLCILRKNTFQNCCSTSGLFLFVLNFPSNFRLVVKLDDDNDDDYNDVDDDEDGYG